jgi:hypothetical protein
MSIYRHVGGLVVAVLLVSSQALVAQSPARNRLARAKDLTCAFSVYATGTWNQGQPHAEVKTATLSIKFDEIDADQGSARAIGAFGASDVIVRLSAGTLHFVQVFNAGPLYTTTVFDSESVKGKLKAVHTRHEYTELALPNFTSRPEQYYGDCEVNQP